MTYFDTQSAPKAGAFAALRWCPFWPAMLLLAMLVPTEFSFSLGPLRLSPYRLVLIVGFFPLLFRLASGKAGRILLIDVLIIFNIVWGFVVFDHHHDFNTAIESGGVRMLELAGAYLIARTSVINEKSYRGTMALMLGIMCVLGPITLFESITGIHAIKLIAAKLAGQSFLSDIGARFGFYRAYGPFDHPILYGVFAASMLGISWLPALPRFGFPRPNRMPKLAVVLGAVSSFSSGALAALMSQLILLVWNYKMRYTRNKWLILMALFVLLYIAVDAFSNRSAMKVFLSYLTFSPGTAYNRIIIFEWGIQDVWRNPVFGIGFNVWTRPDWMHSTSMDNFWLVQAVTFGIPGFLSIALAVYLALSARWRLLPRRIKTLRTGWSISMVGIILAACTVHFWNSLFVYFSFFLGLGIWFMTLSPRQNMGGNIRDRF